MTILRLRTAQSDAPALPVLRGDLLGYRPRLVLLPTLLNDRSLTNNVAPVLNGGLATRGAALSFDGTDDYIDLGSSGLATHGAHTLVFVSTLRSFGVQFPVLFNYLTTGGSGRKKLFFSQFGATGYSDISFGEHGDGGLGVAGWSLTPGAASGGAGVLNVEHRLVLRCRGSLQADYDLWQNGRSLSRESGLQRGTNAQTGGNCVGRSSTNDATNHLDGLVRQAVVFDSILPAALCQELSADPWSMFTSQRRRVVAAAGGSLTISGGIGAATASGLPAAVALQTTIGGQVGVAAASGLQAGVIAATVIAGQVGTATASGLQATIPTSTLIGGQIGAATASGLAAGLSLGTAISAGVGSASATGLTAVVALQTTIAAGVGSAASSGLTAGVTLTTAIAGQVASASASGLGAAITLGSGVTIAANVGDAAASGLQANVVTATVIAAGVAAAQAQGLGAQIVLTTVIGAGVGAAAASGLFATITGTSSVTIAAGVGEATASGLGANIVILTAETSAHWRYDVPQMGLGYDVPASGLRFDIPSIGAGLTLS